MPGVPDSASGPTVISKEPYRCSRYTTSRTRARRDGAQEGLHPKEHGVEEAWFHTGLPGVDVDRLHQPAKAHSTACRKRLEKAMEGDEQGRARVAAATLRRGAGKRAPEGEADESPCRRARIDDPHAKRPRDLAQEGPARRRARPAS